MAEATPIADSGRVVPRWRRQVGEPPKRLFLTVLAVAALALLWNRSYPGGNGSYGTATVALWLLLGVTWACMLANALVRRVGRERLRAVRTWRAWLVVPAFVALVALLVVGDVALKSRFAVSRSDLRKVAVSAPADGVPREFTSRRAGLYTVTDAFQVDGGAALVIDTGDGGLIGTSGGFAYLPDLDGRPLPRWASSMKFSHLGGPWYSWSAIG